MRTTDPGAALRPAPSGFATATVLGLVAVIGLLSVGAMHDALFGEQLAGSRQLHLRAASLAEIGVQRGLAFLDPSQPLGMDQNLAFTGLSSPADNANVTLRHLGESPFPPGQSAGRLVAHYFEIESTGYSARGTRATQLQGATRLLPVLPEVLELPP